MIAAATPESATAGDTRERHASAPAIAAVLASGPNAYETVRSLADRGIAARLIAAEAPRDGRYPGATLVPAPPFADGRAFTEFLNRSFEPGRRVVLIAASDAAAVYLGRFGRGLDDRFLFLQSAPELIEELHDKSAFAELCRRTDTPAPRTAVLNGPGDWERAAAEIRFPAIAKPPHSRDWPRRVGYKIQRVESLPALRTLCDDVWGAEASVLVQEEIVGGPDQIYFVGGLYDEQHRPEQVFTGQKLLQYPVGVGSTCAAHLVDKADVLAAANRFAQRAGISGLVDIEFKLDRRDGQYKIIEVNPRSGLWHRISDDGRMNISAYYYWRLVGERSRLAGYRPHAPGRRWVYPSHHLCSCVDEHGVLPGLLRFLRDSLRADVRCGWDPWDGRRWLRMLGNYVGHVRRLPLRVLLCGRPRLRETV